MLEIEDDLGNQTFRWKNKDIPCVPSSLSRDTILVIGGEQVNIGLTLIVRWDNFTTADSEFITADSGEITADNETPMPVADDFLEFEGVTYKVELVRKLATKGLVEFVLRDEHR